VHSIGDFLFVGQLAPYDQPLVAMFLSRDVGTGRVIGGEFDDRSFTFGEHNAY
jgi:hypothetical protein